MLNISFDIEKLQLRDKLGGKENLSHAFAVRCPQYMHFEIVLEIGKLTLGDSGWVENKHPDLLFAGENS
ncbi:MAG: hypothetical protein FWE49_01890, partial [Synergistaceae bacterium]|nr:hypothetical protein [Synergistaceae bacterium]